MQTKIHSRSIAVAATFAALLACHDSGAPLAEAVAAAATPGCDKRMWIGVRRNPGTACPTLRGRPSGSWFTLNPFASTVMPPPVRAVEMCTFAWVPLMNTFPSTQDLQKLTALATGPTSPLTRLEESCLKMSGMSDVIADALIPEAREVFMAQSDRITPLPQGPVQPDVVSVALVDSIPDSPDGVMETSDPTHAHGRALGLMIKDLACPDPLTCPISLQTRLAFERRDDCPLCEIYDRGAFVGRPAELTVALNLAVDSWRREASNTRLVINLSMGWFEETAPNALLSDLALDTTAVLHALNEANCHGALIFAAAGNTTDGPSPDEGPLFPAAWELRPSLSNDECWTEYGIATGPGVRTEGAPLLFSIGGVDGVDQPSSNVRPGARPRLAAPAEHFAQRDVLSWGTTFRNVMTGSSVSTAVGTAAAAVAWSYRADATASEIAELVYNGGEPLPGHYADYCPSGGGGCGLIHRVSMCGAVQEACAGGGPACPASIACTRRPAFSEDRLRVSPETTEYLEANTFKLNEFMTSTSFVPLCDAEVTAPIGSTDIPCPNYQYENSVSEPANHPQPGGAPCRMCVLSQVGAVDYKLFVGINPDFPASTTISNGSIELIYQNGTRRFYNVPLGPLQPGSEVQLPMQIETSGPIKAAISFLVQGNGATYSSRDPLVLD